MKCHIRSQCVRTTFGALGIVPIYVCLANAGALRLGMVTTSTPRLWACWVWALQAQTWQPDLGDAVAAKNVRKI